MTVTPNPPSSSISIAVTNSSGCSIELDHEGLARDTAEIPRASGSLDFPSIPLDPWPCRLCRHESQGGGILGQWTYTNQGARLLVYLLVHSQVFKCSISAIYGGQ
jgi:hypothetical protein